MIRIALAGLRGHRTRLALSALAVVLGVAFLAGVQLLGNTLTDTAKGLISSTLEGTDAVVRSTSVQTSAFAEVRQTVPAGLADAVTDTRTDIPEYPMERSRGCPFSPPPQMLALNDEAPLSRVRIWDGSTPWLVTGYDTARSLFADSRISVDDRKTGFPHWNEHMLSTVDKRPRSVFTSDAEEHTRFRRMLSKPFAFKRVEGLRLELGRFRRPEHDFAGDDALDVGLERDVVRDA